MIRLIPFELQKIWRKKSFLLAVAVLLVIHVFLLWYTTLPREDQNSLSSYKALTKELAGKSEQEKGAYLRRWKEQVDGVCFVQSILLLQGWDKEMGNALAEQELAKNPGVFEAYYETYRTGEYLWFTSSLEQEQRLAEEIWEEWEQVSGYGRYLTSIQEQKEELGGISIFGGGKKDSYSARNLEKSAADYRGLTEENIRFTPAKTITVAMDGLWVRLLLFLALLLLVGNLITEEKEKGLFLITRSTRLGISHSLGAKLSALLASCLVLTAVFYGVGLLFAGGSAGWFDFSARLQSAACCLQSCLDIPLGAYLLLSVATQAAVFFGIGSLLVLLALLFELSVLPYLAGVLLAGASMLLYGLIPAGSPLAAVKYLNPAGLLGTEQLYGGYLNFNVLGFPRSRLGMALFLLAVLVAAGVAGSLLVFASKRGLHARRLRISLKLPFSPHGSLFLHESYKLLVTGRGLFLLLVFAVLLGGKNIRNSYYPSVGEQYYRDLMETLEGELNEEKERLLLAERQRYEEAFQKCSQIEELLEKGEISEDMAEELMREQNMILSFYPSFERAEAQYQKISEEGGAFVYDTGYRYFLGIWGEDFLVDLLLLVVGVILAVSGMISMEYQQGAWYLLGASRTGKRWILWMKSLVSVLAVLPLALTPLACRFWSISRIYPMKSFSASAWCLWQEPGILGQMPIGFWLVIFVLSQLGAAVLAALIVLGLSLWLKKQDKTVFFALVVLGVPLVLKLLGFEAAKWLSLYPLYGWTGMV